MYDQYYGFTGRPFQLTPDPRFWFESATHRTAMSYLGYGLAQGEGFIVITGEVGSGKTTLVGHVMASIDPMRLTAARLVSTQVADADLLRLVADAFGIAIPSPAKSDALAAIEQFLHEEARAGRRTLLIVDEAQNLAVSALEELRMLSNFQLGETALLQIFLLGQPEFRGTLASPQLEQLRQRVIATHHLEAMLPEEVEPYLIHRLSMVGWKEDPVFAPSAYDELWRASAGIPRRINGIVSRLLLHGAVEEQHELDGDDVLAVVADMGLSTEALTAPVAVAQPAAEALVLDEPVAAEPTPPAPTYAAAPREAAVATPFAAAETQQPVAPRLSVAPTLAPVPRWDEVPAEVAAPGFASTGFEPEIVEADALAAVAPAMAAPQDAAPSPVGALPDASARQIAELQAQVAALTARCDEQDAAIRRVLGLMIQWVENGENPGPALRGRAA